MESTSTVSCLRVAQSRQKSSAGACQLCPLMSGQLHTPRPLKLPHLDTQLICSDVSDGIWEAYVAMVNCIISQPPSTVPRLIFLVMKFRNMVNNYISNT